MTVATHCVAPFSTLCYPAIIRAENRASLICRSNSTHRGAFRRFAHFSALSRGAGQKELPLRSPATSAKETKQPSTIRRGDDIDDPRTKGRRGIHAPLATSPHPALFHLRHSVPLPAEGRRVVESRGGCCAPLHAAKRRFHAWGKRGGDQTLVTPRGLPAPEASGTIAENLRHHSDAMNVCTTFLSLKIASPLRLTAARRGECKLAVQKSVNRHRKEGFSLDA